MVRRRESARRQSDPSALGSTEFFPRSQHCFGAVSVASAHRTATFLARGRGERSGTPLSPSHPDQRDHPSPHRAPIDFGRARHETEGLESSYYPRMGPLAAEPGHCPRQSDRSRLPQILFRSTGQAVNAFGLPIQGAGQMANRPRLASKRASRRGLVWFWFGSSLDRLAAKVKRTSEPPH